MKLLIRSCESAKLKFDSTEALLPFSDVPGQNRAAEAIHFATEMDVDGHNVFVLGPPGVGRHTFVRSFLKDKPSFTELIGKIEHEAEFGTLVTNLS